MREEEPDQSSLGGKRRSSKPRTRTGFCFISRKPRKDCIKLAPPYQNRTARKRKAGHLTRLQARQKGRLRWSGFDIRAVGGEPLSKGGRFYSVGGHGVPAFTRQKSHEGIGLHPFSETSPRTYHCRRFRGEGGRGRDGAPRGGSGIA